MSGDSNSPGHPLDTDRHSAARVPANVTSPSVGRQRPCIPSPFLRPRRESTGRRRPDEEAATRRIARIVAPQTGVAGFNRSARVDRQQFLLIPFTVHSARLRPTLRQRQGLRYPNQSADTTSKWSQRRVTRRAQSALKLLVYRLRHREHRQHGDDAGAGNVPGGRCGITGEPDSPGDDELGRAAKH